MLARFGELIEPGASAESLTALQELHAARRYAIKERADIKNGRGPLALPILKRFNEERIQQIECELEDIAAEIKKLIVQDTDLKRRWEILCSIPGIDAQAAATLLIEISELRRLEVK